MKYAAIFVVLLLLSCQMKKEEEGFDLRRDEENQIRAMVEQASRAFAAAYNGSPINTDSLVDVYYDPNANYVTPWGWTEPVDSMKARIHRTVGQMKDYHYRIENLHVRSYGEGGYAYFIFRQSYVVGKRLLDEYLPTVWVVEHQDGRWKIVHAHRSTDVETLRQYIAMQRPTAGKQQ